MKGIILMFAGGLQGVLVVQKQAFRASSNDPVSCFKHLLTPCLQQAFYFSIL